MQKENYSLSEKIDLIEEYINTIGEEITGKTVYKGYPIGLKLIQLRSLYANGKIKFKPEILNRLNKIGVLERKTEKISDRISELAEYCTKNRQIWLWVGKYTRYPERKKEYFMKVLEENELSPVIVSRNIPKNITDEKEKAFADFLKMAESYKYIRNRFSKGVVSETDLEMLRNAGVGRVFGESKEIIEMSQKTGLSVGEINEIIKIFGSVEEFRKIYIDLIKNSVLWPGGQPINSGFEKNIFLTSFFSSKKQYNSFMRIYKYFVKRGRLITCFDLSEPNFISREPSKNLIMAIDENFIAGQFVDERVLTKCMKESLTPNEMTVLLFMIGNEYKTKKEIAEEKLNVSYQRVSQLYMNALKKLREKVISLYADVDPVQKMSFIDKYFRYKDIFLTQKSFEFTDEMREELLRVDDDKSQEIYNIPIERLGFSQKTYNWLKRNHCNTINDIISKLILKRDAKKISGFGNEKKLEIERKLSVIGISVDFEKSIPRKKTQRKTTNVERKKEKLTRSPKTAKEQSKPAQKFQEEDTCFELKEAIKSLEEVYKELEKEEERYLVVKNKIVKILREKGMTADETTKEIITAYLWQLESVEGQLKNIAERKRKIMEEKNDR